MRSVFDCSLYELNKSHDPEGNLTFIYPKFRSILV